MQIAALSPHVRRRSNAEQKETGAIEKRIDQQGGRSGNDRLGELIERIGHEVEHRSERSEERA